MLLIKQNLPEGQLRAVIIGSGVDSGHLPVDDNPCILKGTVFLALVEFVGNGGQVAVDMETIQPVMVRYGDGQRLGNRAMLDNPLPCIGDLTGYGRAFPVADDVGANSSTTRMSSCLACLSSVGKGRADATACAGNSIMAATM